MKRSVVVSLMLGAWTGIAGAYVIETGTGPTFVYQKDVCSGADGNSLLSETEFCELQWFQRDADRAWIGQSGKNQDRWMTLHFQAPDGFVIQSADVFTRSYIRNDHWETVQVWATWGTTQLQFPWDYLYQNPFFYSRQNVSGSSVWYDENTTTLPVGGKPDLYLTFGTYQSGYADMDWSKEWFVSYDNGTYNPGLKVTLTVAGIPVDVTGKVSLTNYQGTLSNVGVVIDFLQGTTVAREEKLFLDNDGAFTITGVSAGTYTVSVRGPAWLQAVKTGMAVSPATPDLGTFDLTGGDSNGDDAVTFEDFSILQNAYGQSGASAANPLAAAAAGGGCGALGTVLLAALALAGLLLSVCDE